MNSKPILVIGSTGYVGGRLVPLLLASGYRVRAMGRRTDKIRSRSWAAHSLFEMCEGDVLDLDSLKRACAGCRAVCYLVHSMIAAGDAFAHADRVGARNMADAAAFAGLERIIYLGGLGEPKHHALSEHLQSRKEVAEILRSGAVPVTDLRAAAILGAGSASFEILRYTVERLPVMLAPRWVRTLSQPIAIRNVLVYLKESIDTDAVLGQTLDIGGPDRVTYQEMAEIYAEEAGLPKRRIVPVPFVSPTLSAFLIHQFTPVPAAIARPLVEGLRNEAICADERIREIIPQDLLTCREAIREALKSMQAETVPTCWSDAGCLLPPEWTYCGDAEYTGGTILEHGLRATVTASAEQVWDKIRRIGGDTGWYFGDLLWRIRGAADRLAGGAGVRRGRRHPSQLRVGDALDFWRILEVVPKERLLLLAEMKLPGEAVLDIRVVPMDRGGTRIEYLSRFKPKGLGGMLYWFGLFPIHQKVFSGMLRGLARAAGGRILGGPERFTPKIPDTCPPPWRMFNP